MNLREKNRSSSFLIKLFIFYLLQDDYDCITQPILGIIPLIRSCFHLESQSFELLDPWDWVPINQPQSAKDGQSSKGRSWHVTVAANMWGDEPGMVVGSRFSSRTSRFRKHKKLEMKLFKMYVLWKISWIFRLVWLVYRWLRFMLRFIEFATYKKKQLWSFVCRGRGKPSKLKLKKRWKMPRFLDESGMKNTFFRMAKRIDCFSLDGRKSPPNKNQPTGWCFQMFFLYPYLGKIPILTNMFQMGWFNHQLAHFFLTKVPLQTSATPKDGTFEGVRRKGGKGWNSGKLPTEMVGSFWGDHPTFS